MVKVGLNEARSNINVIYLFYLCPLHTLFNDTFVI